MAITFTPAQQQVIQLHDRNILVSAAAGSGKTAVLVERIIRMVCDEEHPVDIDRLLIVTFTLAAASEMRERIAAGIARRLSEEPESKHLQRQAALLHNAQITTIDSFSLFLVRNHFNEIGLDPAFRVADEGEIKLLAKEVLDELLEDAYREGDEAFHTCVEYFCPGGKESLLERHILNLSRYASSFPWPEEWLAARKDDYRADGIEALEASDYGKYLSRYVASVLLGCVEKMRRAKALVESPDGPYMYGELVEKELEMLEGLTACSSLEEYAARIPAVTFKRLPSKKDESVSPNKRELAKTLRQNVKDALSSISEKFFATPLILAVEQGQKCMPAVGTLIDLTLEFDRRMRTRKQEKKIIDFSDMEHYALDILLDDEKRPSQVAREYQEYFHEILIDEYQDSNLVQEYLLGAISGEWEGHFNRFMVGDVKQSIYKFRLARPELFLEKYHSYQTTDAECQRIDLSKNFRSRREVVDTVNDLFSRMMSPEIGGIAYDDAAALHAGADYPAGEGCESEFLLVEKPGKEEEQNAKQAEALAIAQRIHALRKSFRVTDTLSGEVRETRFSDIVILLRSNSGWDEEFKEVLTAQGIPVYITSKTGYFAATEVQQLLQMLRVLDNPRQDIPLCGVMRSRFGAFTDEEIARIRAGRKKETLYEALVDFAHEVTEDDDGLRGRVRDFLACIGRYREYTVYMPIRELLQRIVEEHDYLNYVTALPEGSKRRANVEMLFTKASDFEKTSYFGLFHFVRYMEQLEKYDVDYGGADVLDEHADVVRIMSIHKSKGLEFPITFVAGLGKRFNMQDANQSMIVDMDLGLATDHVDIDRRVRNRTLRRGILAAKLREDNLAEEMRVLYVALTRAKEKLIMTGCMEQAQEHWNRCLELGMERLQLLDVLQASGYLDLLLPLLPEASVRTTVLDGEALGRGQFTETLGADMRRGMLARAGELADQALLHALRERFAYRYPYEGMEKLYTKTTVSELKIAAMADADEAAYHTFEEKEVVPYVPAFERESEKVSGTLRGNAFHRAMELIDFDGLLAELFETYPADHARYCRGLEESRGRGKRLEERLQEFIVHETKTKRLAAEYAEALNVRKLSHFFQSEIAYRMWGAQRRGQLYREQPFVYGVDAKRLGADLPEGETVLIQGIIDVFFIEKDKIVLLDYKTDVIQSMESLWERYRVQLDYYAEALNRLMNMPVEEKVLYSFYLEKAGKDER